VPTAVVDAATALVAEVTQPDVGDPGALLESVLGEPE